MREESLVERSQSESEKLYIQYCKLVDFFEWEPRKYDLFVKNCVYCKKNRYARYIDRSPVDSRFWTYCCSECHCKLYDDYVEKYDCEPDRQTLVNLDNYLS